MIFFLTDAQCASDDINKLFTCAITSDYFTKMEMSDKADLCFFKNKLVEFISKMEQLSQ